MRSRRAGAAIVAALALLGVFGVAGCQNRADRANPDNGRVAGQPVDNGGGTGSTGPAGRAPVDTSSADTDLSEADGLLTEADRQLGADSHAPADAD
jgi:uncharacterized lipoprotein NlpE involved in copper resistance